MESCPSHCETSATRQSLRKLRRERIRKGRAPAGFASKPLRNCNLKNLETLRLESLKTMESCPSHCETSATRQSLRKLRPERIRQGRAPAGFASKPLRNCNLKNLETLLLEPLKTMESCPSHCETSATRQSLRKLRPERIRKGRAPAGFASKPLRNCNLKNLETLLLEPLKTMESCPSHCETSATRQSLRKLRPERIRKGRAPAGFASKPLRNCNLKNLETLLLEPLKTMESCPSHCETSATRQSLRKLHPERIRKGRAPAGFASKPLRNCNLKNLETLLLEPLKTMESCPSHCETSATRQSLRKLRPERIRKGRAPAGFASKPLRNCNLKNLETLLLEPLKTMESCPSHCETSATRQSETSATRQSLRKLRRGRIRKGRAPAGFVPKPLRNRSRKNAETSLLEPIKKKEIVPKPCETAARKLPKRCFWNLLKTKKKPASHQAKLKKKVFGTRMRKSRTPAGFVPEPLRETSLLEPTKNKEKTKK